MSSLTNLVRPKIVRSAISFIFALALTLSVAGSANAQAGQSPLPKPTGYVNDYAGVIDRTTKERLEITLGNLDRQQNIQFAVVTIDTTGGQDIFDYSLAVARGWGVGSKDTSKPSLLLLAAIKDRKYFTQVSRHLEGDLPDGLVGQIQREHLVPAFRATQYGVGLWDTVHTYITTVATKNGFSTDPIFAPGAARGPVRSQGRKTGWWVLPLIAVFVIVIIGFLWLLNRARGGRGGGSGVGSWLTLFLISSMLNSGRGSGSSGWGGGGFGGGGDSSGGGDFGGFGGGGDFGGGGAGGSW